MRALLVSCLQASTVRSCRDTWWLGAACANCSHADLRPAACAAPQASCKAAILIVTTMDIHTYLHKHLEAHANIFHLKKIIYIRQIVLIKKMANIRFHLGGVKHAARICARFSSGLTLYSLHAGCTARNGACSKQTKPSSKNSLLLHQMQKAVILNHKND